MESLFTTLAAAGIAARRPLPRVGLHRRERAQPHRAPAPHPRRRVRAASARRAPAFTVDARSRTNVDDQDLPARDRHVHGRRATSTAPTPPAALRRSDAERAAGPPGDAAAARRSSATSRARRCRRRRPRRAGARVDLRPRPARLATTRSTRATSQAWRTSTTSSSARPSGSACPTRTSAPPSRILQDVSASSRRSPTACSRAMLNQLFLARLMIHPNGFVSNPAFQDASGQPGDRHERRLLRRQQPGRHLRRHGHGDRAGHHARRARRARHELLAAAHAQHRLRHLLGDPVPGLPGRARAAARSWRSSRCCGTAPSRTATRST